MTYYGVVVGWCLLISIINIKHLPLISRAGWYWNLLSWYIIAKSIMVLLYIMIFFYFFSAWGQLYNRVHYSNVYIYSYAHVYNYEVYFQTFMTAAVIVILVNIVLISTAYRLVYQASCLRPNFWFGVFLGKQLRQSISTCRNSTAGFPSTLCIKPSIIAFITVFILGESIMLLSFQLFFLTILFKPITYA